MFMILNIRDVALGWGWGGVSDFEDFGNRESRICLGRLVHVFFLTFFLHVKIVWMRLVPLSKTMLRAELLWNYYAAVLYRYIRHPNPAYMQAICIFLQCLPSFYRDEALKRVLFDYCLNNPSPAHI